MVKGHKKEQWNILKIIMDRRVNNTACFMSSHALARELLSKPDSFITAMLENREYVIDSYKRVPTHANIDDSIMHWSIELRDGGQCNIKR